ncbi:erythromycin esterase family protein [Deinococcus lacus]|uniref:Erythromycin esterase family protein n=1 Tax=Deinococcus lacus TaxID=392561 RepID=A0ABW1YG44_9DEIO
MLREEKPTHFLAFYRGSRYASSHSHKICVLWLLSLLLTACQPSKSSSEKASSTEASSGTESAPAEAMNLPAEVAKHYTTWESLTASEGGRVIRDLVMPEFVYVTPYGQQEHLEAYLSALAAFETEDQKMTYRIRKVTQTESGLQATVQHGSSGIHVTTSPNFPTLRTKFSSSDEFVDSWAKMENGWMLARRQSLRGTFQYGGEESHYEAVPPPSTHVLKRRQEAVQSLIKPLTHLKLDEPLDDLAWVSDYAQADLIGLGEGSHGTQEHAQLKARMFRVLVEQHGFTLLLMEDTPAFYPQINAWLTGEDQSSLRDLMQDTGLIYQGSALGDLLVWMRERNRAGQQPPLQVWGVDSRWPVPTLHALYGRLPDGTSVKAMVGELTQLSDQDWDNLLNQPERLKKVRTQLAALPKAVSAQDNETRYLAEVVQGYSELLSAYQKAADPAARVSGDIVFDTTNQLMVRNTVSLLRKTYVGQKAAIWAHNGHLLHYESFSDRQPMGSYLRKELNDRYKVICLGLGAGSAYAAAGGDGWEVQKLLPPVPYQIDGLVAQALTSEQVAGHVSAQQLKTHPDLLEWLGKDIVFSQIDASYTSGTDTYAGWERPTDACDSYVFVKRSSPTVLKFN